MVLTGDCGVAFVLNVRRYFMRKLLKLLDGHVFILGEWTVPLHVVPRICVAHEIAVCRNPHNSSNRALRITRQLGYGHTFSQNGVFTEKLLT